MLTSLTRVEMSLGSGAMEPQVAQAVVVIFTTYSK
jgi:hypothetical protein